MEKYKKAKIYKIIDNNTNNVYIGSTVQDLKKRLWSHKAEYNRYINKKGHYYTSFEIIKGGDYRIELIEDYPCNSIKELHEKEGDYIKKIDCINKNIAGRNRKKRYQEEKTKILEKNKKWKENNIEKYKKYQNNYKELNREKIREYKKKYRENNKEKIAEKKRKCYENNKEKYAEKKREWYLKNIDLCKKRALEHYEKKKI